jgi:prevent-host-death family protein
LVRHAHEGAGFAIPAIGVAAFDGQQDDSCSHRRPADDDCLLDATGVVPSNNCVYDYGKVTMVMAARTVSASEFKAKCLAMLDDVSASGEEIVITKHGRAVARLAAATAPATLRGSVTFNVSDEKLVEPLDVEWDVTRA